jgi:hypothetical protein
VSESFAVDTAVLAIDKDIAPEKIPEPMLVLSVNNGGLVVPAQAGIRFEASASAAPPPPNPLPQGEGDKSAQWAQRRF